MVDMVVEDGTGLSNANSYVTTTEAEDYLSVKSATAFALWDAELEQENYLMWATRLLDQRANFQGSKSVSTSALRWPRTGVRDRDGISLAYDEIPPAIKAAVIEIAFNLVSKAVDPSAPAADPTGALKRVKADVVEVEYVQGSATPGSDYFPFGINEILSGLGSISTGTGSRFGKILKA